jgi:KDEL-tailed cysteine endopeptidase
MLTSLSQQELVSCAREAWLGLGGCHGGNLEKAFTWMTTKGDASTKAYPYVSGNGNQPTCITSKISGNLGLKPGVVSGYYSVPVGETNLKVAVAKQPTAICIHAADLQHYSGGILGGTSATCNTETCDHTMLLVGYGTQSGKKYWLIKNSWGSWWGEKGYMRLERTETNAVGKCGIGKTAVNPIYKDTPIGKYF